MLFKNVNFVLNNLTIHKMKKLLKVFVYGLGALLNLAGYSQNSTISSEWLLPPRQSYAKIKAISSPITGMMVYDTTNNCLRIFTGSTWDCLTAIKTPDCVAPFSFTEKGGGVGSYNDSDIGADLAIDKNGNVYAKRDTRVMRFLEQLL